MSEESEPTRAPEIVQALERGLAVVHAFDAAHPVLTLSEVARRAGLTRAAARRYVFTLVELGYARNESGFFSLTARVLSLGYAYLSALSLPEVALPHMRALVAQTGESSSLTVLDEQFVVYVAQVPSARVIAVRIAVGTRFPAYATATGRVLLAHAPERWLAEYLSSVKLVAETPWTVSTRSALTSALEAARSKGYALVDRELDVGLRSLAVPVRDHNGTVVAALNVSTHTYRDDPEGPVAELLPPLQTAAASIEADLAETTRQFIPS